MKTMQNWAAISILESWTISSYIVRKLLQQICSSTGRCSVYGICQKQRSFKLNENRFLYLEWNSLHFWDKRSQSQDVFMVRGTEKMVASKRSSINAKGIIA